MQARLLARIGCEVTVVTSGIHYMTGEDIRPHRGWCTEEIIDGIRVLKTWNVGHHRSSILRRLVNYASYTVLAGVAAILKGGKVDCVLAGTDPICMMPMIYTVSLMKRARMVLDERDLFPETAIALGVIRDGLLAKLLARLQVTFRRRASAILTATPGIRKRLIAYGCPEDKVHCLPSADVFIADESDAIEVASLRKETGRAFLVGYAGGLGMANDIPTLLRAAEHLTGFSDIAVVIIGSGERRTEYEDLCSEHGLTNVFFRGAVPRLHARRLLQQMDVCVQPLPDHEHFASTLTNKAFDYHALGRPMIFCGRGDNAELLAASGGGIAVPPGDDRALADAVIRLHDDARLREQMGASARRWFERNMTVERACTIIETVLARE